MTHTTIQVPRSVRDHLAELAKERGISLGQLVERLAAKEPTAAQIAEEVERTRRVLREQMGCTLSDEEFDQGPDVLGNVYEIAAEKVRAARGSAA